jgi:cytochrome bd-type quinol oxidase subunit 1
VYQLFTPAKLQGEGNIAQFVTSPTAHSILVLLSSGGETILAFSQLVSMTTGDKNWPLLAGSWRSGCIFRNKEMWRF